LHEIQTGCRICADSVFGVKEMREKDDWRLGGQENYLKGVKLVYRKYRQYAKSPSWDHDHCAFCWAEFFLGDGPEYLKEGYATLDDYHWICPTCFEDFKDLFLWTLVPVEEAEDEV
jgi:hypothetical protein